MDAVISQAIKCEDWTKWYFASAKS